MTFAQAEKIENNLAEALINVSDYAVKSGDPERVALLARAYRDFTEARHSRPAPTKYV